MIKAGVWLSAALILLTGLGLGFRAYRQHQNAEILALHGPNAIVDARYVTIGGVRQWISIRGEDRHNPVILFVHGGPGDAQSALSVLYRSWEHDFTVVHWDQRGGGLTLAGGADLTPDIMLGRMVADGIEVTEHVRQTLGVDRIVLVGHSWGSVLGVHMIKARPDLYSAYVGSGQIASWADMMTFMYDDTLARARAAHDEETAKAVQAIAAPPFRSAADYGAIRRVRNRFLSQVDRDFMQGMSPRSEAGLIFGSPQLSLGQMLTAYRGLMGAASRLEVYPPLAHADLDALGDNFPIPFFLIEGDDDRFTGTELAVAYFDRIQAPHKDKVLISGGHFAAMTNSEAFAAALVARVRPYVMGTSKE
jgi:pimeloyl-ACP methyl ester carboxylesterase